MEPTSGVAMSKLNNRFSFYMLMFCGVGTICNISFLAFGKWSARSPPRCPSRTHLTPPWRFAAPIELHAGELAHERTVGSKKY